MRIVLLFLLLLTCPSVAAAQPVGLEWSKRQLSAELELARGKQVYFFIDLPAAVIRFRASGVTLAELPLHRQHIWGVPATEPQTRLRKKDALFEPQRTVIRLSPAGKEPQLTTPSEPPALELSDMPVRYRLQMEDGTVLRIVPRPSTLAGRVLERGRTLLWLLTRPLISIWNFLCRRPYTEIRLELDADAGRLLYWSLNEEAACLINWPQE